MNYSVQIPCPVCKTPIMADTKLLIIGSQFKCPNPNCDATIGLAPESKDLVNDAIVKFEILKTQKLKQ